MYIVSIHKIMFHHLSGISVFRIPHLVQFFLHTCYGEQTYLLYDYSIEVEL